MGFNQGNGLAKKEKCKCCVQSSREVNQSEQVNLSPLLGVLVAQVNPAAFPWVLLPAQSESCDGMWICFVRTVYNVPGVALSIPCGHLDHRQLCSPLVHAVHRKRDAGNYFFSCKIWRNPVKQHLVHNNDLRRT